MLSYQWMFLLQIPNKKRHQTTLKKQHHTRAIQMFNYMIIQLRIPKLKSIFKDFNHGKQTRLTVGIDVLALEDFHDVTQNVERVDGVVDDLTTFVDHSHVFEDPGSNDVHSLAVLDVHVVKVVSSQNDDDLLLELLVKFFIGAMGVFRNQPSAVNAVLAKIIEELCWCF